MKKFISGVMIFLLVVLGVSLYFDISPRNVFRLPKLASTTIKACQEQGADISLYNEFEFGSYRYWGFIGCFTIEKRGEDNYTYSNHAWGGELN
jgi:hypothetical protein